MPLNRPNMNFCFEICTGFLSMTINLGWKCSITPIHADLEGKMVWRDHPHPRWLICVHRVRVYSWTFRKMSRIFSNWYPVEKGCFVAQLLELKSSGHFHEFLKTPTLLCVRWQHEGQGLSKQYVVWFQALLSGKERKTVRRHGCGADGWGKNGRDTLKSLYVLYVLNYWAKNI